jgi:hypothetical protein
VPKRKILEGSKKDYYGTKKRMKIGIAGKVSLLGLIWLAGVYDYECSLKGEALCW